VLFLARSLSLQELEDDIATGLGKHVQLYRFLLLLFSVLLAGFAVSIAGTIGFVGLIDPYIARKLVGRPFGSLILVSSLIGSALVFSAHLVVRTVFYPLDIPAGIFTTGIEASFFIFLKNRNQF
jgi:iron complex transport system permease protein